MIKVALIDDHILLRNGLASVVNSFDEYEVIFEADNGEDFIQKLKGNQQPDVVLLDINMPFMDGFDTAIWIKEKKAAIKILIVTMIEHDTAIIRLLKSGINGYILKDSKPAVLKLALDSIVERGYFLNEYISGKMLQFLDADKKKKREVFDLNDKEIEFLKLSCTELSYKEIAEKMKILPRSVEKMRSDMFTKLETTSRVGLALFAIRAGLVKV